MLFFLKNKVFEYFSTSFPCKVKLSFYPNNYLTSVDPEVGGGETGGPDSPLKITSYMGFYREKAIGPPWKKLDPLENVGPPLEP